MARTRSQNRRGDIDAIYNALRPRLEHLNGSVVVSTGGGVGAHTHTAAEISFEPVGYIAEENCQFSQEELDEEKLARSGEQEMLGDLPMAHHSINDIHDADIEGTATVGENIQMTGGVGAAILNLVRHIVMTGIGLIEQVRKIDFTGSTVTEGVIDKPRVIHMNGDHLDDEAKVDGLERMVFNNEPTASSIETPSRVDWNTAVLPDTSYEAAVGRMSWSSLEGTMVVIVASGA